MLRTTHNNASNTARYEHKKIAIYGAICNLIFSFSHLTSATSSLTTAPWVYATPGSCAPPCLTAPARTACQGTLTASSVRPQGCATECRKVSQWSRPGRPVFSLVRPMQTVSGGRTTRQSSFAHCRPHVRRSSHVTMMSARLDREGAHLRQVSTQRVFSRTSYKTFVH